ncbi:ISAs1 family transposase [Cohnella xylanilytica]|uniref:ISAs1 family transposase n=1 Tax=Cohnella xylanilytica TaxID=557555 RepID=UPI001BB335DA|nr:ISAs1 family transposase [Cohnella xylanilytica]
MDWLNGKADWKKLAGIGMIVSERQIGEQRTTETSYFIYSQQGATAQQLLVARRSHWGIENKLHWVLDTVMREDESRARTGHGAENLNVLRHLALNLVKKEATMKGSVRTKLKICGWGHNYLFKVLQLPISD